MVRSLFFYSNKTLFRDCQLTSVYSKLVSYAIFPFQGVILNLYFLVRKGSPLPLKLALKSVLKYT